MDYINLGKAIPGRPPAGRNLRPKSLKSALKILALLLAAAAVILAALVFWMTSVNLTAGPAVPEESFTFKTDTFQVDLPRSFRMVEFTGALQWPGERIRFKEAAYLTAAEAARRFDELVDIYQSWGVDGLALDVSQRFGRPAWLAAGFTSGPDGAMSFNLRLAAQFDTGWITFEQFSRLDVTVEKVTAAELGDYQDKRIARFLSRAWNFLRFYTWVGPDRPEAENPGDLKTRYGQVAPRGRSGYVYAIQLAEFEDPDSRQRFYINSDFVLTGREPSFSLWARLALFSHGLLAEGEPKKSRVRSLILGGQDGREFQTRAWSPIRRERGVAFLGWFAENDFNVPDSANKWMMGLEFETIGLPADRETNLPVARWQALMATLRPVAADSGPR